MSSGPWKKGAAGPRRKGRCCAAWVRSEDGAGKMCTRRKGLRRLTGGGPIMCPWHRVLVALMRKGTVKIAIRAAQEKAGGKP